MENKAKILIIEDDDLNQQLYKILLERQYDLSLAKNSDEFYKLIHQKKYDLFIVDITLQGFKNGLELTNELRKMDEYLTTPVIVVTANAFKVDETAAINAGANQFIRKPFNNKELLEAIKNALKLSSEESKSV